MFSKLTKSCLTVLNKRCFSASVSKQELSSTITRLDYSESSNGLYPNRNNYNGKLNGAVLDWSGTVADAHVIAPAVVFCEVFKRNGVPITMSEAREPMGLRKDLHIAKILEMPRVKQAWIDINGSKPTQDTINKLYQQFVPLQVEVLPKYTTLLPGIVDVMNKLQNEYKMKIGVTTGFTSPMTKILVRDAIKQGFKPDSDVAGDQVPEGLGSRPKPFMLYQNLLNMGVWPIESVLKMDDCTSGVQEGLNAGCWTVGVYGWSNYTEIDSLGQWENMSNDEKNERRMKSKNKLLNSGAHYVIETVNDLPNVVDDINKRLQNGERPMSGQIAHQKMN